MAKGDKGKLFGKETVKGMKEVKNLSKLVDEMLGKWDDLTDAQKTNVDLVKEMSDGMSKSNQYSEKNKNMAKETAFQGTLMLKGGKLLNALNLNRLKVTQAIGGANNKIAIGMAEQASGMEDMKNSAKKLMGSLKQGVGNILSFITPLGIIMGIVTLIVKYFKGFSDLVDRTGKQFGAVGVKTEGLTQDFVRAEASMQRIGENFDYIVPAITEFQSSMGLTNKEAIALGEQAGEVAKTWGVGTDVTGKLISNFEQMAGTSREMAVQMSTAIGVLAGDAGVAPGVVMEDVANSSELIAKYGKDGGANIAKAAVNARKFGNELATAEKIADSLLNFEDSITKEFEASVLLGKQLNFQSARQKALQGDVSGAMGDVVSQLGGAAEWEKLNVIQRQAMADSIGVSVGEMAKFINKQDELGGMVDATSGSMEEMTPEAKAADALSAMSQAIGEMRAQWTEFLGQFGPGLEGQALVILDKFKQLIAKAREFALWAFSEEGQKKIKEYGKMLLWAIGIWYSLKIAVFAVNAATILFEGTMKLVNGAIFLWNKRTKAWAALTKVSTALQWAWNAAMAANPIGVIILAIVALVGIVWYLWKNWDKVWGMISNVFSWIWDKIKWVGSKIWGFATQIFEWLTWPYRQAWDALVTIWGGLGDWFGNIWEGVKEGFSAAWEWITGIFNFDSWVENIKTLWNGLLTVLKSPFNLMIRGVNFLISGLNKISISIPSWVPKIGGKTFGFNFKKLDYLETGTEIGGVKDGTVAQLHKGETVLNAKDSATLQAAVDGGMDYDKLAVALAGALAGMNLKTSVTKEQLNIALTNTEG